MSIYREFKYEVNLSSMIENKKWSFDLIDKTNSKNIGFLSFNKNGKDVNYDLKIINATDLHLFDLMKFINYFSSLIKNKH